MNTDDGFITESNKGSWGAVLRDEHGKVIMSTWGIIPICANAELAEGIAVLEGVKAILPYAAALVVLESDNARVVRELNSKDESMFQLAFIMADTREMLKLYPGLSLEKSTELVIVLLMRLLAFVVGWVKGMCYWAQCLPAC